MNIEKEKDKNERRGGSHPPFKPLPLVEQVKCMKDPLGATQATNQNDEPIVRPPALEKPSSMLVQGTLSCGTGRGLGTGWKWTGTGVRHLNQKDAKFGASILMHSEGGECL